MSSKSSLLIKNIDTKREALSLITNPRKLFSLLYSKYGNIEEDLYILYTNKLIYNSKLKINLLFKEIKYDKIIHEILRRFYSLDECIARLPRLYEYYKNYHLFFCRPTFCYFKLGKIINLYKDKQAEIFYQDNYQDSAKEEIGEQKKEKGKKNSSFSISSLENTNNNNFIFDEDTKKMLDKVDSKSNNFYNTLLLDSSRTNLSQNNELISRRNGGEESFENCIHELIEYPKKKNKKNYVSEIPTQMSKKSQKVKLVDNKFSKIKKDGTQKDGYQYTKFNLYNFQGTLMKNGIKKMQNNYINNFFAIKSISKKKMSSQFVSFNKRFNTSASTTIKDKLEKREFQNNNPSFNNRKMETSHIIQNSRKINKTNACKSNNIDELSINNKNSIGGMIYNSNVNQNSYSNTKLFKHIHNISNNNYQNFVKYTETNMARKAQNKATLHKKNSFSITDNNSKKILFRLNEKNRKNMLKKQKLKIIPFNDYKGVNKPFGESSSYINIKSSDSNFLSYISIFNNSRKEQKVDFNKINVENLKKSTQRKKQFPTKKKNFLIGLDSSSYSQVLTKGNSSKDKIKEKKNLKKEVIRKKDIEFCNSREKKSKIYDIGFLNPITQNNLFSPINIRNPKSTKSSNIYYHHISPRKHASINGISFKKNLNQNNINKINKKNNIFKKLLNKENKIISKKSGNHHKFINSCNFNNSISKKIISSVSLINSNINNTNNFSKYDIIMNSFNNENDSKGNNYYNHNNQRKYLKTNSISPNKYVNFDNLKSNIINNNGNINISIDKNNINIKDSILHIDKIFIKKDNNKNNINQRLYTDINYIQNTKKPFHYKILDNNKKKKKEKTKFIKLTSPFKLIDSQSILKTNRNFKNIIKKIKNIKKKY